MKITTYSQSLNSTLFIIIAVFLSFVISVSVFAQSEKSKGIEKSSMHRSTISNLANELNRIADRDGGIGAELRDVAKEQNVSKEKVVEAIEKVENRSGFKTFFIGTDYKNLGALRSEMVTTDNHIDRLTKSKERAVNPGTATDIDEQIAVLEAEKVSIETFITENEDKFSLFGWFVKLFN